MKDSAIQDNRIIERVWWLIKLRWIAIVGVLAVAFSTDKFLAIPIPIIPLYVVAIILAIYNLLFILRIGLLKNNKPEDANIAIYRIANTQISLDLLSLTTLIHFSGGVENPFIFYFIFHIIIASVLLSRKASFLQATFAVILFCSMVILEYFNIIAHYHLSGFITHESFENPLYISGVSFVFISTLYIAVYMATSISKRLRDREESLREANALLGEKDRLKSEYVLRVTHDIKDHLSAIHSCIEPVAVGITGQLNKKQADLLNRAKSRTEKLLFFIRALLEVTRIKLSKEIKKEEFHFRAMLSESISDISLRAKNKNISVVLKVDIQADIVKGAREYIQEAITNLLVNSVKYTPEGGRIEVSTVDKDSFILTQIKDTGIGVPKDEIPRLFEEFYRASNAKKIEKDGTGLGLSIAKQVVERHGGKIWLESEEGKGTTVSILLPK